jgi:hypothetical protein
MKWSPGFKSRKIKMKRIFLILASLCCSLLHAQTRLDLAYTKGTLPVSRLQPIGISQCLQTSADGTAVLWAPCPAGSSGSGTVTTFSAGLLTPLFSTSVVNASTTPALTFTLNSAANHLFWGNNSGATATPSYVQPKSTDLADFSSTAPTTSGKIPIFDQPSGTYIPGDPLVQGLVADGSTTAANPVAIGGYDTAGTPAIHRGILLNTSPAGTEYGLVVRPIPSGTQAISAAALPLPAGAATSANQPTLVNGRTPVDPSGVTSPISAASLPLPTGAATSAKQPALGVAGTPSTDVITMQGASGMTPVKVDGSAVTQPVSGTVTANAGTGTMAVSAASLPLPAGAATSANQSTVKAASTSAATTDTSSVVQLSPNQPQLTTPLNTQGAKTNNNAAPGATNYGTLPAIANAAPPSYTEGNQTGVSMDLNGIIRVNNHPPSVLGCYMVNGRTGTYGGQAAGAPLFAMRWGDATHFAIVQSVKINVATTTAATAATQAERELIIARSWTVSDSGGTAVTLTGNNQKMRTSQATSLVTDMRFGQPLTAGTRTLDANPVSSVVSFLALNMTGMDIGCGAGGPFVSGTAWTCVGGLGMVSLLDVNSGDYPIFLAQNEGILVRIGKDAQPTTAVQQTYVSVKWCEVNNY